MAQIHVVDAGILFSDWTLRNPSSRFVTTHNVISELKNRPSLRRAESLISTGYLVIEDVDSPYIEKVRSAAEASGDIRELSEVDIELVGLALQKKESGQEAVMVSTDLALLNTARHLDIDILDPTGRMKRVVRWALKCPACGHTSSTSKESDCVVCGTRMRRTRRSQRRLQ